MKSSAKIVLVALAAGALGAIASLLGSPSGPLLQSQMLHSQLLRSEAGQRLLNSMLAASAPQPPAGVAIARRGQTIPAMTLSAVDGHSVSLPGAYADRPLLINVWASWCGPCLQEIPELQRFSSQQAANGVQVVGIALDDATDVRAFLQRLPVSYPILLDPPGPADAGVRLGNPKGILPYSVLVSGDGRLLKQRIGPFAHGEIETWTHD